MKFEFPMRLSDPIALQRCRDSTDCSRQRPYRRQVFQARRRLHPWCRRQRYEQAAIYPIQLQLAPPKARRKRWQLIAPAFADQIEISWLKLRTENLIWFGL